ncbi:hypothetical protein CMV_018916 [Castanea mollissima]|uniref:Uncharacterized protein n=1 Tax=Castanea mollissima TaxID=60419 RepID=A0A8J4QLY5_9ROSI|nr:hypothetical protein CMV_018916 [Castanea mollissima]
MSNGLRVLHLGRNNLTGKISDTFPSDCSLQTLNVNKNLLEGLVPKSLANCTNLEVLDIGNNQIHDVFPCYLKGISNLRVLVLQSNKFYGYVGCGGPNVTWPMLQIVDLASNNFSGKISIKTLPNSKAMMVDNEAQSELNDLHFEESYIHDLDPITSFIIKDYYQDMVLFSWNKGLYGCPLKTKCAYAEPRSSPPTSEDNDSNSWPLIDWNYISLELGFVFGLGMIIWPLVFCKRWRIQYCKHVDDILFRIFPQLYLGGKQYRGIRAHRNVGRRQ